MTKFPVISAIDLNRVCGGIDWADIKKEAQPYCPKTVDKYGSVEPSKVDRPLAKEMGEACLAEMDPGTRLFARGRIHKAIDKAFPPK